MFIVYVHDNINLLTGESIMTDFVAIRNTVTNHYEKVCNDNRKAELKRKNERLKKLNKRFDDCRLLVTAGLLLPDAMSDFLKWIYGYEQEASQENLVQLRALFGEIKVTEEKEIHSAENNTVRVYLSIGDGYSGPRWYVVRQLEENSRCKIETRSYSDTQLVCSVE
jgi:hypothetical protein